jgi:hypothetical protein
MKFTAVLVAACGLATALLWPPTAAANNFLVTSPGWECAIAPDLAVPPGEAVVCQGNFSQAPQPGAGPVINADGTFHWEVRQLNHASPTTGMNFGQTYHYDDWTMYPDQAGTRFINDHTGRGFFISLDNVYPI